MRELQRKLGNRAVSAVQKIEKALAGKQPEANAKGAK
jgi:hypothetical protein